LQITGLWGGAGYARTVGQRQESVISIFRAYCFFQ